MGSFQRKLGIIVIVLLSFAPFHSSGVSLPSFENEDWKPERLGSVLESTLVRYYMFNLANPEEVESGGVPQMEEIGPFTYREKRVKTNLVRENETRLSYDVHWSMHYLQELTGPGLREQTEFTSWNMAFVTLATGLNRVGLPRTFNDILIEELQDAGEKLYARNTPVGDTLFYGVNVSLYTAILDDITQGQTEQRYPEMANGKFSFYKNKNDTIIGKYVVESTPDIPFGRILTYNGNPFSGFWQENSECDKIQGSLDSYTFPKHISKNTVLKVFLRDNCRSLRMEFVQEDVFRGIPVYVFKFPLDQLSNSPLDSSTSCFCSHLNISNPQCLDAGLIDYSTCSRGAPLVGSFPHFLHANPKHLRNLKGITPNKSLHESEVMIEPITGTPLYAVRRFQVNLRVRPLPSVTYFQNTTERLLPLAWLEHILEVPSSTFAAVKEKLDRLKQPHSPKDIYHHDGHPLEPLDDNTLFASRSGFPGDDADADAGNKSAGMVMNQSSALLVFILLLWRFLIA